MGSSVYAKYVIDETINIVDAKVDNEIYRNENIIHENIIESNNTLIENSTKNEENKKDEDKEAPKFEIKTNKLNNGKVKAIIKVNEPIKTPANWQKEGEVYYKVYDKNVEEQIKLQDLAGNISYCKIVIKECSYIDVKFIMFNSSWGSEMNYSEIRKQNFDKKIAVKIPNFKLENLKKYVVFYGSRSSNISSMEKVIHNNKVYFMLDSNMKNMLKKDEFYLIKKQ